MLLTSCRLAAAALALAPASAAAQFTVYTSLSDWLAAAHRPALDTFDDLPGRSLPGPLDRAAGPYTYRATVLNPVAGSADFFPAGTAADRWLATDAPRVTVVFSNFAPNVVGVGGFFFGSNVDGAFVPGTIELAATNAGGAVSATLVDPGTATFWGVVSTGGPVSSFTVRAVQSSTLGFVWPTANDVRLSTIPEPSTYLLVAGGLVALGAAARCRARG